MPHLQSRVSFRVCALAIAPPLFDVTIDRSCEGAIRCVDDCYLIVGRWAPQVGFPVAWLWVGQ